MGRVVAIDIGGTTIKSAVAAFPTSLANTKLLDIHRTPTPIGDAQALLDAVVHITRAYGTEVDAVGVVMPGILDVANGIVRIAGNLRLQNEPIVAPLQAALGIPVHFEHDGRAGALAEFKAGAARGLRDAAVITLGTGVSASFIIDGALRNGAGFMGEIGHAHVGPEVPCVCGLTGCLEAVSSASAIARRYQQRSGVECATPAVIARAGAGDAIAAEVWGEAIAGLVRASAWIASVLGSEAIILSGGLALAGESLFQPVREGLAEALQFQRIPSISAATQQADAGCLGAAIFALQGEGIS